MLDDLLKDDDDDVLGMIPEGVVEESPLPQLKAKASLNIL